MTMDHTKLCAVALTLWAALSACSSYAPGDAALDALQSDAQVTVLIEDQPGNAVVFQPTNAADGSGLIFYPGGLVQHEAYAPALRRIAEAGHTVVLLPMPSDLAVFAPKKADKVLDAYPEVSGWVIGGHSLGGAMAATYADKRPDEVRGLILWASYPSKAVDLSKRDLPVLSLTATEDLVLKQDVFEDRKANLPASTQYDVFQGGNHAGFGDYGPQDGDGEAEVPAPQQWAWAAEASRSLLAGGLMHAQR